MNQSSSWVIDDYAIQIYRITLGLPLTSLPNSRSSGLVASTTPSVYQNTIAEFEQKLFFGIGLT
jgi:hypothetical protein